VLSSESCGRLFPEGINTQRLPAFKELNSRFTKSFWLGGLELVGYLHIRNLLNFKNVLQVFAINGSVANDAERQLNLESDLDDLKREGELNNARDTDGSLVLDFPHEQCNDWISSQVHPAAANCLYLIRAEQRFGDGDGVFTVAEQTAAVNALYDVAPGGGTPAHCSRPASTARPRNQFLNASASPLADKPRQLRPHPVYLRFNRGLGLVA
jgi:hypothetical protein